MTSLGGKATFGKIQFFIVLHYNSSQQKIFSSVIQITYNISTLSISQITVTTKKWACTCWLPRRSLPDRFAVFISVWMLCFNISLHSGFLGHLGSGFLPKAIKETAEDKHNTMMKWINNIPPGNPIQLVPVNWSVCVSHWGNNDDFCLSLVGSNPRPCLPVEASQMEGRGRRRCFVFHSPFSLLSQPRWDHLPSQLKGMFVLHICLCSQMIFVIKLRLSGISRIPGWWHCALLFWACGCLPWKM